MWEKVSSIFGGGNLISQIGETVDRFVTTGHEKEVLKLEITKTLHAQELELQRISLEADHEFNQRIKDLEGTSKDLLAAGLIGKVLLFFRGAQRPVWGFSVMVIDFLVFSGRYELKDDTLSDTFWAINLLVLGFLFGERAVKNIAPSLRGIGKK